MKARGIRVAIATLAWILSGVGAPAPALADDKATSLKIGVIDLGAVFKAYQRSAELEADLNAEKDRLEAEIKDVRTQIERADNADEKELLTAKFQLLKKRRDERLKARLDEYNGLIRSDIQTAVAEFGESHSFNLILAQGAGDAENEPFYGLRGVVFVRGLEDVTPAVVALLNEKHEQRKKTEPRPH